MQTLKPIFECDICEREFHVDEGAICQECNTAQESAKRFQQVMERAESAEAKFEREMKEKIKLGLDRDSARAERDRLREALENLVAATADVGTRNQPTIKEPWQKAEAALSAKGE